MNAAGRSARDALIERMHKRGIPQVEISRRVNMAPSMIWRILVDRGALPQPASIARTETTVYDSEDPHRIALHNWKRQVAGARAALKGMQ